MVQYNILYSHIKLLLEEVESIEVGILASGLMLLILSPRRLCNSQSIVELTLHAIVENNQKIQET